MEVSKWKIYDSNILELIKEESSDVKIAQTLLKTNDAAGKNDDVNKLRTYIARFRKRNEGVRENCENLKIDTTTVKHLWLKNKEVSAFVKNPDYQEPLVAEMESLRDILIRDLQKYSPKFPKLERTKEDRQYLMVLSPADCHVGKLCSSFETGEDYDSQIAVKRVKEGVAGVLDKVSTYKLDKIMFIGGNDILHVDNPHNTTTKGTRQDTSGMWYDNFLMAKQLYVDIIEMLLTVADVHFVFNPGNHDTVVSFMLADVIKTYFRNCPNITFDCSMAHRKGFRYYNNLIGSSHGDQAKTDLLPLLMAQEFPQEWAATKHRYVYIHHIHHKTSKDYVGVTVESLRSPSGTDSYHHKHGYQHAPKAVEAFIHCKDHGQILRVQHLF